MSVATPFAPRCLSLDLEVGKEDGCIHQFAGVRGDSDEVVTYARGDLNPALARLDALATGDTLRLTPLTPAHRHRGKTIPYPPNVAGHPAAARTVELASMPPRMLTEEHNEALAVCAASDHDFIPSIGRDESRVIDLSGRSHCS